MLELGDDTFGGCVAQLSVDPQNAMPLCAKGWSDLAPLQARCGRTQCRAKLP